MAFDSRRGVVVLFGGIAYPSYGFDDTWEWNGDNWIQRLPAHSPPGRTDHAMAYDAARGVVLLFGGHIANSGTAGDMWAWDGEDWTQQALSGPAPDARRESAMSYDPLRERIVLFGGRDALVGGPLSARLRNDLWEWDGASWTERTAGTRPSVRQSHAMAFDPRLGGTVLVGGWGMPFFQGFQFGELPPATWVWHGASWSGVRTAPAPPSIRWHSLSFESSSNRLVLFGGEMCGALSCESQDTTWLLVGA